jgi:uncharacterized protein YhaN
VRIAGWRVEGFGLLADHDSGDLGAGLTILHGPNEAGKTTLLAFLRGVLFGFPDGRSRDLRHEPLRGGRHGGVVRVLDDDRAGWTIERHAGEKVPLVTRPDGSSGTAADLQRLLGGVDATLFRSVFAFSLTELTDLASLERGEVRDLLFSAGVVGAGKRATGAMRLLEDAKSEIVRPKKADARANALWRELHETHRDLLAARATARSFPGLEREVEALADSVDARRRDREALHRRLCNLDKLCGLYPLWTRRRESLEALELLAESDGRGSSGAEEQRRMSALAPLVAGLTGELSGYVARCEQRDELQVRRRPALVESIEEAVSRLGADFHHGSLEGTDAATAAGEVRGIARAMSVARSGVQAQRERAQLSEEGHQAAVTERQRLVRESGAPRPAAEIDGLRSELRAVRMLAGNLEGAGGRERADAGESPASGRSPLARHDPTEARRSRNGRVLTLVMATALAAAAGWSVLRDRPELALACALGLALIAGARLLLVLSARRAGWLGRGGPLSTAGGAPVARPASRLIAADLAARALALGLDPRPSDAELDHLEELLECERNLLVLHSVADRHVAETERTAEREAGALVQAARRLAGEEDEWAAWKQAHDLAACASPDDALELLAAVSVLQDLESALGRLDGDLERLRRETRCLEARVAAALTQAGLEVPGGECDVSAALGALERRVADASATSARRAQLEAAIGAAERHVAEQLGRGDDGEALREELFAGEMLEWEQERKELSEALLTAEQHHEEAVRDHQDRARQLFAIGNSADIAQLEIRRETLRDELEAELLDWWSLSAARALISTTLVRYERERQPVVVARASEIFSAVTDGYYTRLVPRGVDSGARERGFDVLSSQGARVDAAELSRGTVEQLYLCLRLALAETFAERAVALPLVMDDVLVNFDPERARGIAEALAATAACHQVLLFTCHPHVVELLRDVVPGAGEILLARHGAGATT